jgi:hypothetical protein
MRKGDPSSIRWRLAAAVGPELVALGLVILLAVAILLVVRLPLAGDPGRQSPQPSASPGASAWNLDHAIPHEQSLSLI